MNKTELVEAMANNAGITKKVAEEALKAFTDAVADELKKGGKIKLDAALTGENKKEELVLK